MKMTFGQCQDSDDLDLEYSYDLIKSAPGSFAQKPVPPGTVRAKNIFRTGRFLPGRFAHFSKNDFKVLVIKINQVNAMCMLNLLWT